MVNWVSFSKHSEDFLFEELLLCFKAWCCTAACWRSSFRLAHTPLHCRYAEKVLCTKPLPITFRKWEKQLWQMTEIFPRLQYTAIAHSPKNVFLSIYIGRACSQPRPALSSAVVSVPQNTFCQSFWHIFASWWPMQIGFASFSYLFISMQRRTNFEWTLSRAKIISDASWTCL